MNRVFVAAAVICVCFAQSFSQTEQPLQWVRAVRKGPNEITIKWTRYPIANFKRYRLIRDDGKVEQYNYESVIDSIPNQGVTEYTDTKGVTPDKQYHYYIKVIGDNYSVLSTTDKWADVGRWANLSPVQVVVSNVEADGTSVNLQWEQSATPEFYEYAVFRTQQPDDLKKLSAIRTLDHINALPGRVATLQYKPEATALVDKGLNPNETYYYFIAVVSTDQQVQLSRPVTVRMPPPLPEQLNPVLKASQDSGAINLAWSGYRGRDFERYWLVRMYSASGNQPSRTDTFAIPGIDSVYRDLNTLPGNYTYQIGVKTADHGTVASNWASVAIRPKRSGADMLRIWISGETIKSENGTEYSLHPFFMNDYGNDVYAAGFILQGEAPANPVFPYVVFQWRGHDDPHPKPLLDWLKTFNINAIEDAKLLTMENALAVAVHTESHGGDDAQFQDSLVRVVMKMSVVDTATKVVKPKLSIREFETASFYIDDELRSGYPRMMALELTHEHQHFVLAAGIGAILGLLFLGALGLWFITNRKLSAAKPTGPETLGEYMKRAKDAAFMDKLGRQLAAVSATMTVTEALKQLVAKLEGGAGATTGASAVTPEHHHASSKGHEIPPALVQALIRLHQAVEHNFAHYGNYERFSAHQAENVITDYISVAKTILTLPIEGEKFGHSPSPHDIEKKLNEGTTVLKHVFEEIQHERGVLRKVREEINIHEAKDVHEKVLTLKRAAVSLAAIQAMLERGNLISQQPAANDLKSSDEIVRVQDTVMKRLEEVIREKGAVDQKLAVAFPSDDERTRLLNLIDQILRVQHQLHIRSVAQVAAEVEGVAKYAEGYMELAQELKRLNPAVAVGDPHEVRAEFKKHLGR